jgi:hypothetical protein
MMAGGVSISVPSNWVPLTGWDNTGKVLLALGRLTVRFVGTPASVDIKQSPYTNEPWTRATAESWQLDFIKFLNADSKTAHATAMSEGSAKYPAICTESRMDAKTEALHCAIVGTALQFDFIGGPGARPEAEQILASLH